jgi:hypothetical protein
MEKHISSLCWLAGFGIVITLKEDLKFTVDGFYKSGSVLVDLVNKTLTARYAETTALSDTVPLENQLYDLNVAWQERSAPRSEFWEKMDPRWERVGQNLNMKKLPAGARIVESAAPTTEERIRRLASTTEERIRKLEETVSKLVAMAVIKE